MRTISRIAAAAAAAAVLALPAAARAENECGAPGATAGGTIAGDRSGSGGVYGSGDAGAMAGYIGEESDRGYIQVDGSTRGVRLHGTTKGNNVLSGDLVVNGGGASACASPAGQVIRVP